MDKSIDTWWPNNEAHALEASLTVDKRLKKRWGCESQSFGLNESSWSRYLMALLGGEA